MRFEQESLHSTLHQRHKMVIALIPYFCDEFWRKFELNGHTPILPNLFSISLIPQFVPAFSIASGDRPAGNTRLEYCVRPINSVNDSSLSPCSLSKRARA